MKNDRQDLLPQTAPDEEYDFKAQDKDSKRVKSGHKTQKGLDTKTDGLTDSQL
jgi:hypothetical protein